MLAVILLQQAFGSPFYFNYRYMKAIKKLHSKATPRKNRVSILLNDSEMRALERYCNQYTVKNRSRLIRETLMRNILKRFDNDSPTLFD